MHDLTQVGKPILRNLGQKSLRLIEVEVEESKHDLDLGLNMTLQKKGKNLRRKGSRGHKQKHCQHETLPPLRESKDPDFPHELEQTFISTSEARKMIQRYLICME